MRLVSGTSWILKYRRGHQFFCTTGTSEPVPSSAPSKPRTVDPRKISFSLPPRPHRPVAATAIQPAAPTPVPQENVTTSTPTTTPTTPPSLDEFFPTSLITPQPDELLPEKLVKRPHLWITSDDTTSSVENLGRYMRYSRSELAGLLPEGLAGETARDIYLMPSRTRDIGIMYRKSTCEIVSQLSMWGDGSSISKSGWVLDGKRGCGKSSILNSVVAWARQNNWLVLFEPIGSRFGKEVTEIARSNAGIYLQNELSRQLLERFVLFNEQMLDQMDVDMKYYGMKVGLDSSSLELIERVYLPLIRDTCVDKWKRSMTGGSSDGSSKSSASTYPPLPDLIRCMHAMRKSLNLPSMKTQLSAPKSLRALCEFGISNQNYATQTVAELLVQLKLQSQFPLLIAVDEWNEMFVTSDFVSARYDNTPFNGHIPGYHLALSRMLSRWDGHEFKRGVKLFATSWAKRNRRQWNSTLLGVRQEEIKQVRNFTKFEFANYCAYQALTGTSHRFPESKLEYFYMLTQGNGFEARRMMATLF